jgi:hypothetical protein
MALPPARGAAFREVIAPELPLVCPRPVVADWHLMVATLLVSHSDPAEFRERHLVD